MKYVLVALFAIVLNLGLSANINAQDSNLEEPLLIEFGHKENLSTVKKQTQYGVTREMNEIQAQYKIIAPNMDPAFFDSTALEPTKVFDNLYCIGSKSVVAWALTTSDGIILIDTMWDDRDAELIIEGMEKLGLDPTQIKYIAITHGHIDHYGGAQYLKDKFGAKILMSEIDWELMDAGKASSISNVPRCRPDSVLEDGQKLTLGDTTLTVVSTPGHSPGCMSFIFPVTDNGTPHMCSIWGGSGAPGSLDAKKQYQKSIDHFAEFTKAANVDAEITAHLFAEKGFERLEKVRNRQLGEPNPFVLGHEGYLRYEDDKRQYIEAAILKQEKNEMANDR